MKLDGKVGLVLGVAALGLAGQAFAQQRPQRPQAFETDVPEEPLGYVLVTYDGQANVNLEMPDIPAGKVACTEVAAAGSVPLMDIKSLMLAAGLGCQWNRFEFSAIPLDDVNLYALTVPIDLIYSGLDRWTFWANATPGLFSDMRRVDGNDYRTLLHGLALYRLIPPLQLAAGASYDREFGDDKVYPIGGVIWNIDKQWQLDAFFPCPLLQYAPTPRCVLFANARPAGGKWNLRITDIAGDGDFKLESWQVGVGAEVEVVKHIWVHAAGGMDVDRSYEVQDAGFTLKSEAGETWFARAGVVVR